MFTKQKLITTLKILVSVSILVFLLANIEWEKSIEAIESAKIIFLLLAFASTFLNRILINYKQYVLLRVRKVTLTFWKLFNINMIGAFWGMFLPSSLSTDVVRGFYLMRTDADKSITISSVVVDRFLGVFSLLFLAAFGLIFSGGLVPDENIKIFIVLLTAGLIIVLFIFQLESASRLFKKVLGVIKYKDIGAKLIKLQTAFLDYKKYPKALGISFVASIFVQLLRAVDFYFIGLAFGVEIPILYLIILVPIIMILVMIPISIGGIGVREGAFVGFLKLVGISTSVSIVIALTSTLITTIVALYGGIAYMFYKSDNPLIVKKTEDESEAL